MERGPITRLKHSNGFSVLEVLISVTIILIVATALVPLFVYVAQGTESNKSQLHATSIAQRIMEEIKQLPYEAFDANGNLIIDDETIPQIGTYPGGNPFGSVPKEQFVHGPRGDEYLVKTTIDWVNDPTSAGPGIDFKRIQVVVEAPNIFTGNVSIVEDVHSWVAKEGEERVFEAGHIHVEVMTSTGLPIASSYVEINMFDTSFPGSWSFDHSITQGKHTVGDGTTLFGIIPDGDYRLRAKVPTAMMVRPDIWNETVTDADGNFSFPRVGNNDDLKPDHPGPYSTDIYIQNHVLVSNWATTEVLFDTINKPSYIELELRSILTGKLVDRKVESLKLYTPFREITAGSIENHGGTLNKNYLGPLWPQLNIADPYAFGSVVLTSEYQEYINIGMIIREKNPNNDEEPGSPWNGVFTSPDETITLVIWTADFLETSFADLPTGQAELIGPGAFIISDGFTQPSNTHITLADDSEAVLEGTILFIDNDTEFIMNPGSSISGYGIIYVKGDMYMHGGASISGDVIVYVGGSFNHHSAAQHNNKVISGYPGFIN